MIKNLTKEQLDTSFKKYKEICEKDPKAKKITKYNFLSSIVFDFVTYDHSIDEKWGKELHDVMRCLKDDKPEEYWGIDEEHYNIFLIICQLLIKKNWLDWGPGMKHPWFEYDCLPQECDKLLYLNSPDIQTLDHIGEDAVEWNEENLETLLSWMEQE